MNTPLRRYEREHAITRAETIALLCVVGIFGFLAYSALFMPSHHTQPGRMTEQLNNGRQIYLAMRNYAEERFHKGEFPTFRDPDAKAEPFAHSSEAFEALLPFFLEDKQPYFNQKSAWCRVTRRSKDTEHKVLPGDNDWVYVRGLRKDSPEQWPLLANAFAPGTKHYVAGPKQPGGVWDGKVAVIVYANGSAEIIDTRKSGDVFFIPRADKPTANAFTKDGEWLAGEHVEVLYPLPPPPAK